ncbi:MAG: preprotein translocase subunit SecG [Firmicutes bacterium]|nr:preprotein translocase subunit SecG [Bacillota bacterium]
MVFLLRYIRKGVAVVKLALTIVYIVVCLGLIATVLLQSGRSAGLSGAIAGGAQTLFGKKKGMDDLLGRISTGLAITFMILAIVLTILAR